MHVTTMGVGILIRPRPRNGRELSMLTHEVFLFFIFQNPVYNNHFGFVVTRNLYPRISCNPKLYILIIFPTTDLVSKEHQLFQADLM